MNVYSVILIVISSYLIGSISGGVIVGKIRSTDIRQKGSKAAGATNAFRTMGTIFALTVLIIDVYKGYFVVEYIPTLLNNDTDAIKALAGIMCILGHAYPLYFKFKGGKGVGTALGALIAFPEILPLIGIAFASWVVILIITGYVGLSSILATLSVPILYILTEQIICDELGISSLIISLFIIFTHRENIKRMINGTENRFEKVMIKNLFKNK
ncbi:glycerol-3-phosphate 1-O-acyltransferase PlsY [bacterium]|nr:glycerol-3-phosphate 1-O-acyltransferase PlsY [bacterium]